MGRYIENHTGTQFANWELDALVEIENSLTCFIFVIDA